jgi:hypothetical protein
MKRILIVMLILAVSIMFTACSDSSEPEQTDKEEVKTNEEVDAEENEIVEEEEIEVKEINVVEGGIYTDKTTGAIAITVPMGYVGSEDALYSTANTVATVTITPQFAATEAVTSFLLIQVTKVEHVEGYADTYINTFAKDNENVEEIEIAGLKGFSVSAEDEITGWNNENYILMGPQNIDGSSDYMVLIMGYGLDNSYVDDVHSMIYTLNIEFDKL